MLLLNPRLNKTLGCYATQGFVKPELASSGNLRSNCSASLSTSKSMRLPFGFVRHNWQLRCQLSAAHALALALAQLLVGPVWFAFGELWQR